MKSARNGGRIFCVALAAAMLILAVAAWFVMTRYTTETELLIQQHRTGVGALTDAPVTQRFTVKRSGLTAVKKGRCIVLPRELFHFKPLGSGWLACYQILTGILY